MATAAAPAVVAWTRTGAVFKSGQAQMKSEMKVSYVRGLNSYGGLKAQNNKVVSMGLPVCTEQCFANVVMSLKGRTIGFVLLRIEASVEEAE
ncbi:hypothetical protein F2Q69_00062554 [Brassica cretica]|uniref:Uncharacterized protein n=2 Tax=Brassica cretica TaxID=69181 RepID=A0A8S9RFN3_BRACR|nr:hypothetical protein DY000_02056974 [Brassica cretica]KAF3571519.1 hypothetical protein F2Q69_00062554 [Brassica cretica]